MGILQDSTVATDVVATVDENIVDRVIGECTPRTMALVDEALRRTFGLSTGLTLRGWLSRARAVVRYRISN